MRNLNYQNMGAPVNLSLVMAMMEELREAKSYLRISLSLSSNESEFGVSHHIADNWVSLFSTFMPCGV